jgi:ring-1,2-phenylacetyl-CoA epoxidase subunit PaaA
MRWKIKRFTNDSLRQKFIDATVPQGHYLGLTFPDPQLRYDDATGHWAFGAIDWDEFRRVLAGDGPCNRERLAARRQAHEDGAWVREAALAYAAKQKAAARRQGEPPWGPRWARRRLEVRTRPSRRARPAPRPRGTHPRRRRPSP